MMGEKLPKKAYEKELYRLQAELVKMQNWTRASAARIVVVFEGRDAAGKGGTISRVGQYLNPRFARTVALDRPSDRETGQWYFQRYIAHLPTAGEIVLFDRSWYNRAGVERVMGFCTKEQYSRFLRQCPAFERMLVEDGILLRKYWFSVSDTEQQARFESRLDDPLRRWKLSPMDLESITRWEDYSRAKDDMFTMTDIPEAPWYVVESDDKRRARINMIAHLLSTIPYRDVPEPKLKLPHRPPSTGYVRTPRDMQTFVPDHAAALLSPRPSGFAPFALILVGWPQSCELTVMRQTCAREQRGTTAAGRRAGRFCQLLGLAGARGGRVRRDARGDRRRA
jgi:polyphosphate kinase 2